MTFILIPLIYCALLALDGIKKHEASHRERIVYRTLAIIAIALSFPTALASRLDHVGASLSGFVSMFSR